MSSDGFNLGFGPRSEGPVSRALKDMVRKQFGLAEDDSVFVAEIVCGETGCPDVETVIAIFLEGSRREFKLPKPVREIAEDDIRKLAGPSA